jgi:hypothetical protein
MRAGSNSNGRTKSFPPKLTAESARLSRKVEAAGIEPASDGSDGDSEAESNLPSPDAGQSASEASHELDPKDDEPRSERGPSGSTATRPDGAGDEPPRRA